MSEFYRNPQSAILKVLSSGTPLYVEYFRNVNQPNVVLDSSLFWGLFHNDEMALFIVMRREKKDNTEEWFPEFNWVTVDRITVMRNDVGIKIDTQRRSLTKESMPLIYNDQRPGCEAIDAAIRYHIDRRLFEMGLIATKPVPPGSSQITTAVPAPQIVPESAPQEAPVEVESSPVFDDSSVPSF